MELICPGALELLYSLSVIEELYAWYTCDTYDMWSDHGSPNDSLEDTLTTPLGIAAPNPDFRTLRSLSGYLL